MTRAGVAVRTRQTGRAAAFAERPDPGHSPAQRRLSPDDQQSEGWAAWACPRAKYALAGWCAAWRALCVEGGHARG